MGYNTNLVTMLDSLQLRRRSMDLIYSEPLSLKAYWILCSKSFEHAGFTLN